MPPHSAPASVIDRVRLAAMDARWFQIFGQGTILLIGIGARGFDVSALQLFAVAATALGVQWVGSALNAIRFDWKSPLITTLSLALLLRANDLWPLMLAAAIGIGSKFAIRLNGKHLFNPANAGIVAVLLMTDAAWTSAGQWGSAPWFAAVIAALGALVTFRARRLDVPLVFLGSYAAILISRALWLGDPLEIPTLRLLSAELILFAFFMISDPKTTADDWRLRAGLSIATALLAYVLQFHFFIADGLFYAPFILTLVRALTGLADRGQRYEWGAEPARLSLRRPLRPKRRAAPAE